MNENDKIVVTGAAGLVGQNLIVRLKNRGYSNIVAIDKHPSNTAILRRLHPDIEVIETDLADGGAWETALEGAAALVLNQAQIGGLRYEEFERNNVGATANILKAVASMERPPFVVHISSSVVNSIAVDFYTETKKAQEKLVLDSGLPCTVLRPTLMFGWFDRKHLGWLKRFMEKVPVFPIPGSGAYIRQPLYVGDFCEVIMACLGGHHAGGIFDISGQEEITYIEIIKRIRETARSKPWIVNIPYSLFWAILRCYAWIDSNPPFTTRQLQALTIPEKFPVIDWPGIFGVRATTFQKAVEETFLDPVYSGVVLEF